MAEVSTPIRQSPLAPSARPAPAKEDGTAITFCPEEGGSSSTTWRGIVFKAHIPVMIKDQTMIDAAKGNRFFSVGDEIVRTPNAAPKTRDEYRNHVVAWLKEVLTTDDLAHRWARDRNLRTSCEVGSDDLNYLGTLIDPKLRDLQRADGLSDPQVATLFIQVGILDLPWRA
jgi:hypothetical protein